MTAVEEWRSAVAMAERNMRANGLEARLLCAPAEEAVGDLRGSYGAVVVDPPRDGCDRAEKEYIKDGHAFCKVCHERKDGKVMEFFDNKMIFKISRGQ